MQIKKVLFGAAALSAQAAADFIVITDYPDALRTASPAQQSAYISRIAPSILNEVAAYATDTSFIARATSVAAELRDYAATATVSLPPHVTALDQFEIYTTVPSWYAGLPSGVRALYDEVGSRVEGLLPEATPVNASASVSVSPSASVSANATTSLMPSTVTSTALPENTGSAGRVEAGLVGGVVAGVVGVLMM